MILRLPGNLFCRFTAMYRKVSLPRLLLNLGGTRSVKVLPVEWLWISCIEKEHVLQWLCQPCDSLQHHALSYVQWSTLSDFVLYFQPPKALSMTYVKVSPHGEIRHNPNYPILRRLKSVFKIWGNSILQWTESIVRIRLDKSSCQDHHCTIMCLHGLNLEECVFVCAGVSEVRSPQYTPFLLVIFI